MTHEAIQELVYRKFVGHQTLAKLERLNSGLLDGGYKLRMQ